MASTPMAVSSPEPSATFTNGASYPSHSQQQQQQLQTQQQQQQQQQQRAHAHAQQKVSRPAIAKASSAPKLNTAALAKPTFLPPLASPPFSAAPLSQEHDGSGFAVSFNINNVTINKPAELQRAASASAAANGASSKGASLAPPSASSQPFSSTPSSTASTPNSSPSKPASAGLTDGGDHAPPKRADSKGKLSGTNGSAAGGSVKKVLDMATATGDQKSATASGQPAFPPQAFVPYGSAAYVFGSGPFDLSRFQGFHPGVMPIYAPIKQPISYGAPVRGGGNVAEKRANHNAIERARRDSLNNRFQEIADCIPQLRELKKPSKSVIMNKTLEYVKVSQKKLENNHKEIQALKKENERLKQEMKQLRSYLAKAVPGEVDNVVLFEPGHSPLPTTPPQEENYAQVKGEGQDEYGANDFGGNSFLASDLDEDSPDSFSRESSVSSRPLAMSRQASQFDMPLFQDRQNNEDNMDLSDNPAQSTVPYHQYLATRDMMHHELLSYHGHHHHRGSYHSSSAPSLNSSALASPETPSFPENEFLEDFTDTYSEPDSFSFDYLREKVQHGLAMRHDQGWLERQNIMKHGPASLQATKEAMEFNIKKQTLKTHLSSRPSVDDLIGMNIMQ